MTSPVQSTEALLLAWQRESSHLLDDVADLIAHTSTVPSLQNPLPAVHDLPSYTQVRVRGQAEDYYRPRAQWMNRRLVHLRRAETGFALAAAVLVAIAGALPGINATAWVGVLTTIAAAVATQASAAQYEHQQVEFSRTADRLERLLVQQPATTDPQNADEFVERCEQVLCSVPGLMETIKPGRMRSNGPTEEVPR